ncbi:MAG: NAD(P)/FAD-dependent oxidoreductase [Bacteroidota bacterium]
MNRRDFLQAAGLLGIGTSMGLAGCSKPWLDLDIDSNFSGDVIIIGAGAAGIAAAHALDQYGINFQILEASNKYLGRIAKENADGFIWDSGAEWLHAKPKTLSDMAESVAVSDTYELLHYSPADVAIFDGTEIYDNPGFSSVYGEYKFRNGGWYDFFATYFLPDLTDRIKQIAVVTKIDYSGDRILVETDQGVVYTADRVICTVPLSIYKNEGIEFIPSWPSEKVNALDQVDMPDGIKVLFECTEQFYPDILGFDSLLGLLSGEALYYNATYGREEDRSFLALFAVGDMATPYAQVEGFEESFAYMKDDIARIFGSSARDKANVWHIQNWSKLPYIQGSYSHYKDFSAMDILAEPLDGRVYFAGEALSQNAPSTVHGAFQTGLDTVERLLIEA